MGELEYSIEARNVINRFHGVDRVVYVEGEDDVAFWEVLFHKFSDVSVRVEECGGKPSLAKRINDIVEGKADFYVAVDSDFDVFMGLERSPKIFTTFGYSIENTLVHEIVIQKVISRVARLPKNHVSIEKCAEWLETVEEDLRVAVLKDIVNRVEGLGCSVIPDNCDRFTISRRSEAFCRDRIERYLRSLNIDVDEQMERNIIEIMERNDWLWRDLLRGHFLVSAALKFVKRNIERSRAAVSISKEMFFGSLVLAFEASFDATHRHYEYYRLMFSRQI